MAQSVLMCEFSVYKIMCFCLCKVMDLEDHLTIIWDLHQSDKAQEDQVKAQMGGSTGVKRGVIKRAGEEVRETPGAIEEALEAIEEALEANGKARKCSPPMMKSTWDTTGTFQSSYVYCPEYSGF